MSTYHLRIPLLADSGDQYYLALQIRIDWWFWQRHFEVQAATFWVWAWAI